MTQLAYKINEVLVCWTPKCACTSIWRLFQKIYNEEFERIDTNICIKLSEANLQEYKNFKKIMIIRNPYYRLLSAYLNKLVFHGLYFYLPEIVYVNKFEDISDGFDKIIIKNDTIFDEKKNYVGISFNEFVELVSKYYYTNFHFNKQNILEDKIKFDYVVHVENLQEELKEVFKKLNFTNDFEIRKENTTAYSKNPQKIDLSNIKSIELIKKYLNDICIENFLNEKNKEIIYNTYKEDFILGNYDK